MKQFWIKTKVFLKPIGNWTLFTLSVVTAFCIGYYYPAMKTLLTGVEQTQKGVVIRNATQCTVSVTDRGELLILDRTTGTFEIYEEPVGMAVFKAYGNVLTSNQPK